MKTTVEITDHLLMAAKKRAVELRLPLRQLIMDGLRQQLRQPKAVRKVKDIRWVTCEGGLPVDISDRVEMHNWLRKKI